MVANACSSRRAYVQQKRVRRRIHDYNRHILWEQSGRRQSYKLRRVCAAEAERKSHNDHVLDLDVNTWHALVTDGMIPAGVSPRRIVR